MRPDRPAEVLAEVLRRLVREHGRPGHRGGTSAVGELVGTILSQNTTSANADAGFRRLWRRFRSWSAVADAPVGEIEKCIRVCGLSRLKAPRIRNILRQVRASPASGMGGRVSLEFLRRWPMPRAREYLLSFDGVGPKTAACVLLFAFGKCVFPVDTHIRRIAVRLGLLEEGTSPERAQEVLEPLIRPGDRLAMHLLLIAHGRRTCRAVGPRCPFCTLADLCRFRRRRAGAIAREIRAPAE